MNTYHYTARDITGTKTTGAIDADNEQAVIRTLSENNLFPVTISASKQKRLDGKRVSPRRVGVFYRQLADLLRAGSPLLKALEILERATNHVTFKAVLKETHEGVAAGKSLAQAMSDHPGVFNPLHVAMITAGEKGGFVERVLDNTASFIERLDELKNKVTGAMIYPAILSGVGTIIVCGLLIFLVPLFRNLFKDVPMPLPTRVIFAASALLTDYWPFMIGALVIAGISLMIASKQKAVRLTLDRLVMKLPMIGPTLRMVAITRFCRILGAMLDSGTPMLEALRISADATGSITLQEHIHDAADHVSRGGSLRDTLSTGNLIPIEIVEMIGVAEESNQMEKTLITIADTVEARTNRKVDLTIRMIEPAMLIILASVIGFIAFGILYPVLTMATNIKG